MCHKGMVFLKSGFLWFFKQTFLEMCFSQNMHPKGLSPVWVFSCSANSILSIKHFSHELHLIVFSLVWDLTWLVNWLAKINVLPQEVHWNISLLLVWIFDAFVYNLIDWRDFTVLGLFHIFSVWTVLVSFELIFFSTIRFSCLWTQSWLFQMQLLMTLFSKQRISLRDCQVKSFKRLNLKKGQNIRKGQNIKKS